MKTTVVLATATMTRKQAKLSEALVEEFDFQYVYVLMDRLNDRWWGILIDGEYNIETGERRRFEDCLIP